MNTWIIVVALLLLALVGIKLLVLAHKKWERWMIERIYGRKMK